jgi:hypothetical protein
MIEHARQDRPLTCHHRDITRRACGCCDTNSRCLLNSPVRTIAFVDKKVLSAGALIALSCEEIYMTSGSSSAWLRRFRSMGYPGAKKSCLQF